MNTRNAIYDEIVYDFICTNLFDDIRDFNDIIEIQTTYATTYNLTYYECEIITSRIMNYTIKLYNDDDAIEQHDIRVHRYERDTLM